MIFPRLVGQGFFFLSTLKEQSVSRQSKKVVVPIPMSLAKRSA